MAAPLYPLLTGEQRADSSRYSSLSPLPERPATQPRPQQAACGLSICSYGAVFPLVEAGSAHISASVQDLLPEPVQRSSVALDLSRDTSGKSSQDRDPLLDLTIAVVAGRYRGPGESFHK